MNDLTEVLGTVAMVPKGEYDSSAYYEYLNVVTYEGSTYMAKKAVNNVLPTNEEYWQFIAGGVTDEELNEAIDNAVEDRIETFDTVANMKLSTKLKDGMTVQTLGYYAVNDGGGATYKITDTESETEHQEEVGDLYATLIVENVVNVKHFGAYGDNSHDDTTVIQNAIDYASNKKGILFFSPGVYVISDTLNISKTIKITGEFNFGISNDNKIYGAEIKQVGENKTIFYFSGNNYGSIIEDIRLAANTSENRTAIGIDSEDILSEFKLRNVQFAQFFDIAIRLKQAIIGTIENCTFSICNTGIDFIRGTKINILNNNFWNNGVDIKIGEMNDSDISNNWFESRLNNTISLLYQAPCAIKFSTVTNNAFQKVENCVLFDGTTNITDVMSFVNLAFKNNRFSAASPWIIDMKNLENVTNRNTGNRWTIIIEECVFNNATSGQAISIDYDALGSGDNGMKIINCIAWASWTGSPTNMFTSGQANTAHQNSDIGGYRTNGAIQLQQIVHYTQKKNNSIFLDSSNNMIIRNNEGQDNAILVNKKGSTANRPASANIGDIYYDTTIYKPLWWSGNAWVDATGNVPQ